MMSKKDGQMQMIVMYICGLIPQKHLLKQIDKYINFDFIGEKAMPYYSKLWRKSIDPFCMIKMLLML